jgi:Domain of unknown function (DUF1902)
MKRTFYVKALWDTEAKVWYSESDIFGLHIETKSIEEFKEVMDDVAAELIVTNHLRKEDLTSTPLKHMLPTIVFEKPENALTAT